MDTGLKYIDVSVFQKDETKDVACAGAVNIPMEMGICDKADISFSGTVKFDGLLFVLEGCVKAALTAPCDRCLKDVAVRFEYELKERYIKENAKNDEKTETEHIKISDNKINLHEAVSVSVLAELPKKILCAEDCLGLCQHCGNDKNENECSCEAEPNTRLAELFKNLDIKKK